jgi:uncharacterized protein (DUF58 family)
MTARKDILDTVEADAIRTELAPAVVVFVMFVALFAGVLCAGVHQTQILPWMNGWLWLSVWMLAVALAFIYTIRCADTSILKKLGYDADGRRL